MVTRLLIATAAVVCVASVCRTVQQAQNLPESNTMQVGKPCCVCRRKIDEHHFFGASEYHLFACRGRKGKLTDTSVCGSGCASHPSKSETCYSAHQDGVPGKFILCLPPLMLALPVAVVALSDPSGAHSTLP